MPSVWIYFHLHMLTKRSQTENLRFHSIQPSIAGRSGEVVMKFWCATLGLLRYGDGGRPWNFLRNPKNPK